VTCHLVNVSIGPTQLYGSLAVVAKINVVFYADIQKKFNKNQPPTRLPLKPFSVIFQLFYPCNRLYDTRNRTLKLFRHNAEPGFIFSN